MFIIVALAFILSIGYMATEISMYKIKENYNYQNKVVFLKNNYNLKEIEEKKQLEQALKTTCQLVKTYSEENGCGKKGWDFVGGNNTTISFNTLNTYSKSNNLNCSDLEKFARYKLFNSISHLDYSNYSIKIEYPISSTDECNIKDFVFKSG